MLKIETGSCSMGDKEWNHIISLVEREEISYLDAFKCELELYGINLNEVYSMEINGGQKEYMEAYAYLATDLINYYNNKGQ